MTTQLSSMENKTIRWYQEESCNEVLKSLQEGAKRILIELPTGAGKTFTSKIIFAHQEIRKQLNIAENRPLRLLFVASKNRLLDQAENEYQNQTNITFIRQSAFKEIPEEVLQFGWDIACIDEAHHEAMMSIQHRLEKMKDKPIIGLTATPDRADGHLIKFENIIAPITRSEAVKEGYLAETAIHTIIDTSGVNKTNLIIDVINEFHADMQQTLIFLRTKNEVRNIQKHLEQMNLKSVALIDQSDKEMNDILDDFDHKKIQFIVNCDRINEGVDLKGCTDVFLGRTFKSYPQINQAIGRAARPDSGCNVWQLANPLKDNLDTSAVVGDAISHRLLFKKNNQWNIKFFGK